MPKIKVVCRHGVEYSLLARGTQAEANRLKEGWANVYKHEWGYGLGNMYSNKKTAEASIPESCIYQGNYIATVKIEWEEEI